MDTKITGTITRINDSTTSTGIAVKQLFFKKERNNDYIYPSALGKKVELLDGIKPGDRVELSLEIRGSREKYNNVVIENLTKL